MIEIPIPVKADLDRGIRKTYLDTVFATEDDKAHRFDVALYRGNEPVTLPSGASVSAYFIRYSDNGTLPMTGEANGNTVSVTLTKACYNKSGAFALIIKVIENGVTSTVFYGEGSMFVSRTDTLIDTENVIPSLDELLAMVAVMENATADATTATASASAAAKDANEAAQRANTEAAAAQGWAEATATAVTLEAGEDADVKLTTAASGAKELEIYIPRGESGVYVGTEEPTDPTVQVWIDPDGEPDELPSGVTPDEIQTAVDSYLTEHPVTSGATEAQAAQIQKNKEDIAQLKKNGTGGTAASVIDKPLIMQNIGVLYDNPEGYDYIAWCPGNLRYDPNLDKYVSMVYGSTQHVNGTTALFVSYIDPKTYEATVPVRCYTDNGSTAMVGSTAFWIDDDGTYKMLYKYTDNKTYLYTSTDGGINWVKGDAVSGFSGSPWGITKLSNGRLIFGDDQTKVGIYYSDNGGVNWTQVIPGTAGGDYEAEACILELEPGKLIAIARYSMSGIGYSVSGSSEPAIVSFSEDYGTTWTAWKKSATITNMNASTCAGYVHNGRVDVFAASRWYWKGNAANDDYTNTGKTGAITHYTATVENALQDNFTNAGILTYANAYGSGSSQDFHSPALAVKGDDVLLMWFDRIYPYTNEVTSHYFARGSASCMDYAPKDDLVSVIFPYSSAQVKKLLAQQYADLITKVNEAILSGGLINPDNPNDPDAVVSYIMDGVVLNFNFLDTSKQDTTAMTLTDTINGVVGTFKTANNGSTTVSEFPAVRDNSMEYAQLVLPANTLSEFITDDPHAMTVEFSIFYESVDEWSGKTSNGSYTGVHAAAFYSNGGGANSMRICSNEMIPLFADNSGSNVNSRDSAFKTNIYSLNQPNVLHHCAVTMAADGTTTYYKNGEITAGPAVIHSSFAKWAAVNLTRGFTFNGPFKSARIYKRALTADEVMNNYKYELNSIK